MLKALVKPSLIGSAVSVATFCAHSARSLACAVTVSNCERMKALVLKGLEDGAFGLSSGLDYKPSFWATTDEVIAVAKVASGAWRTNFTNHERVFPGNGYSSMAGMRETLEIGEKAGLMPVITHMKLQGRDNGKTVEALALATDAKKRGVDIGMDAYPYTYGSTILEQLTIPSWAQEGGRDAIVRSFRFADFNAAFAFMTRAALAAEMMRR